MAKRKAKRSSSRKGMPKEVKNIIAGMAVAVGEPILDQLASNFNINISDDIIKIGAGFGIKKLSRGQGMGNAAGDALMIIGANRMAQGGFAGLTNLFGGSKDNTNSEAGNGGATF